MSKKMNRRSFIRSAGAATAAAGTIAMPSIVLGAAHGKKNVVIVGGGTGGATAAKYLKRADPSINVTLIEPNKTYYTCYLSNVYVIGGGKGIDSIGHGYGGLAKHGVKVVHDYVTGIDAKAKKITLKSGGSMTYDRCIVSPGIDFKWESTPGYDEAASGTIAHAWNAGAQTAMLRKQLEEMKDGGTFLMAPPPNPFKCPPGPYERAAQVAGYFKKHKPKSKVLILDPKGKFSKFGLFKQAWSKLYGFKEGSDDGMIVWRGTPKGSDDNKIVKVDVAAKSIETGFGTEKGDVLNIIPAQKAGKIAFAAGLTKGDWCPVNLRTFESTIHKDIYVIGDSSAAKGLPKSGYAANSEAKVAAAAVAASLNGKDAPIPAYVNTCYSIAGPGYGFSVAAVYRLKADGSKVQKVSGGLTPSKASPSVLASEETYAHSWYKNITNDIFG